MDCQIVPQIFVPKDNSKICFAPLPTFGIVSLFYFSYSSGGMWCCLATAYCISQMPTSVEPLGNSLSLKYLFKSSAHFQVELFVTFSLIW